MLTKVRQFLAAEATRLSRDLPGRVDQDEAAELVAYRTAGSLQQEQAVTYRTAGPVLSCLHGRPTALCLHEFRSAKL
jgi:hypothetical protein